MAKTLSEKAAAQFAQDHNLDLVIINPALVSGPFLISKIPNSVKDTFALIMGKVLSKQPFLYFRLQIFCFTFEVLEGVVSIFTTLVFKVLIYTQNAS